MKLKKYLRDECEKIIQSWNDAEIYAISFFVYANESYSYKGIENFPEISIGYNTEADCEYCENDAEERWNFAFWSQNNTIILDCEHPDSADLLVEWYKENGIDNPGEEREDEEYGENGEYIGKGPAGYYDLLMLMSEIAREFQNDDTIKSKFGSIPIIVHDLEYPWYVKTATENANPHGEAKDFLTYFDNL